MNNAHLSHSPSRFKQVVIDVMKKNSKEKMKTLTDANIPSMTKLNESRMSQQLPTPKKGSHHIKFDDKKTISTDEVSYNLSIMFLSYKDENGQGSVKNENSSSNS